jgi:hypothetical protein
MRMLHKVPLLLAGALLAPAAAAQTDVIINEVLYDPAGADGGLERIEFKNIGAQSINLFGSSLAVCYPGTLLNNRTYWPFGPGFKIDPGQIVTLHYLQDGIDTNTDFYTGASGAQFICVTPPKNLDNAVGSVAIFNTTNCAFFSAPASILDFVQWGGTTYHELQAGTAGIWPFGASFPDVPEGHSVAYTGTGDTPADYFDDKSPTIGLYNESPGSPFIGPLGPGCAGSAGVPGLATTGGPPALGNQSFHLRLGSALPGAPAVVAMSANPAALPIFGCTVHLDVTSLILELGPKTVDPSGEALFFLPIPDDVGLLGIPFQFQGAVVDAGSPSGIVAFSDALVIVL